MGENNKPGEEFVREDSGRSDHGEASSDEADTRHQGETADDESHQTGAGREFHEEETDASASDGDEDLESESGGEVGRLREALLRTRAEMDNLHKRAERELEKTRKFAVESLLRDLVPIIDSLDQGIEACGDASTEGLELTRKLALDTFKRYGLEIVDPGGDVFDPQWHEAMSMVPSDDHESGQIITVLQRGYRLHDRVVRAARVIVAK